ncbi:MAG: AAA family ATPase [Hyphomicrobiaceae bacterium]
MLHEARPSAKEIAKALGGRRHGVGYRCPCPAHDDKSPSLDIKEKNGKVLFRCRANCTQNAVLTALMERGLWPSKNGLANGHSNAQPERVILATYDYVDEGGQLVFQVVRYAPKEFRQRRPNAKGGWTNNVQGILQVPYRLPELAEAISKNQPVFVVEGEKDCDSLVKLGIVATCSSGGAGNWRSVHAVCLKDANVVILPDNDEPGRKHADAVAMSLQGIARQVRVLALPDLADKGDVSDWILAGGTADQLWQLVDRAPDWQAHPHQSPIIWGVPAGEEKQPWLIEQMLPETGIGLLSGQWGTYKTFVAMDLAAAVLTEGMFAGRQIARKGGVLWLAAEGQSQVPVRLRALATKHKLNIDQFAWAKSCPLLTDAKAREALIAICLEAKVQYRTRHDLPLALVIIDTIGAAAGWKDENSAAEAQAVMSMLASVANELGICIAGIDHFGKVTDTGTRGASPKEDFSDFVLALLGDRDLAGEVKNSRVAVRKVRGGPSGMVVPFAAMTVQLDDGQTSCTISWQQGAATKQSKSRWPNSLRVFKISLDNALVSASERFKPTHDSVEVIAVDIEGVRTEFYQRYVVAEDGTDMQKQNARQKAFKRASTSAQNKQLIGAANLMGKQFVWAVQERE